MKTYKYEIFTKVFEKNIREGLFQPGHKLPSVRELKNQYKTSISTILNGYEQLVMLGLVESIPKSGYYVSTQPGLPFDKSKGTPSPVVRDPLFEYSLAQTTAVKSVKKSAAFNVTAPGDLLIPQKLILRTMQQVIREKGASLLRYYPSNGSAALRSSIVKRAAYYQTRLRPEELIITDGALQALYIALATVCASGDIVAIESPCVFSILEVVRMLNLKVIEIPVDPGNGFDIAVLQRACLSNVIKAVLITPNFHNPTGTLLADEQKKALLAVIQRHGIPLIENDIYGDLNFTGQRPATLGSFDESGLVMTYSSYAKTLAPGIRLGWLSPGKFMERAEQIKFSLGSTVSPVYQETVQRLMENNSYERHVRAFRMQLGKNAYFAANLLKASFPEGTSIWNPSGGYSIWVKMPEHTDMNYFYSQCEKVGVKFTPGYTFSLSNRFSYYFRLIFAGKYTPEKAEAIKLAGQSYR